MSRTTTRIRDFRDVDSDCVLNRRGGKGGGERGWGWVGGWGGDG